MEQLNIKTKEEKTMHIFTTNWYLYKTHLHSIAAKPQEKNSETTNRYGTKKRPQNTKKNTSNQKTTKFEQLLLESIDEGLSVLGESSKQIVYSYLEKSVKMNRHDIPHRIEEFIDVIEKIFGTGAKILEIQIMKCLFSKVGYKFKNYSNQKSLTFIEYVEAAKMEKKRRENTNDQQLN